MLSALLEALSHEPPPPEERDGSHCLDDPLSLLRRVCPGFDVLVKGTVVLDYGCGTGAQSVAMAEIGAREVVGIEIQPELLRRSERRAQERGVGHVANFKTAIAEEDRGRFDVVISQNSFEHFLEPEAILADMKAALAPSGLLIITFGPPWYHPHGAHMYHFTSVPWVHLLFPERTVLKVRARYHDDGARRYEDVQGGLGRMSLRKFHRIIRDAGLEVTHCSHEPVKRFPLVARTPILRELLTGHVTVIARTGQR